MILTPISLVDTVLIFCRVMSIGDDHDYLWKVDASIGSFSYTCLKQDMSVPCSGALFCRVG